MGRGIKTEHGQQAFDLEALSIGGHDDHGLLAVAVVDIGRRLAHEDHHLAAGIADPGNPPFAPIDDIFVAVALDMGFDIGGVGRSHGGLGHGEGGSDFAGQQGLQPFFLDGIRRKPLQDFHIARIGGRTVEDLWCEMAPAHDFTKGGIFQIGQAKSLFAIGKEHVPKPFGLGLGLQFLHGGQDLEAVALFDFGFQLFFVGQDMGVHELPNAFLQFLYLIRMFKIHFSVLPPYPASLWAYGLA